MGGLEDRQNLRPWRGLGLVGSAPSDNRGAPMMPALPGERPASLST
jgi:hypothetical protein